MFLVLKSGSLVLFGTCEFYTLVRDRGVESINRDLLFFPLLRALLLLWMTGPPAWSLHVFCQGFQLTLDLPSRTVGSVGEQGRLCWVWPSPPPFRLFPERFTLVILAESLHIAPFLPGVKQCIHYCSCWYGQALNKSILRRKGLIVARSLRKQSIPAGKMAADGVASIARKQKMRDVCVQSLLLPF